MSAYSVPLVPTGPNLSDGEFHNVLAAAPGARDRGCCDGIARLRASAFSFDSPYNDATPGALFPWLHYLRRTPENKAQFNTPTLRNAALTAPYMHNGRYSTLEEVIDH
jgi:cytochrome c peroxidase